MFRTGRLTEERCSVADIVILELGPFACTYSAQSINVRVNKLKIC